MDNLEFYIITGMSGAGKHQGVKFFEDNDFFCIDNLPANLLREFLDLYKKSKGEIKRLAFGIDARSYLSEEFLEELRYLRERANFKIIFLNCSDAVLLKRYGETKRKHPFGDGILSDNLVKERGILEPVKNMADIVIDTSLLSVKELGRRLRQEIMHDSATLNLKVISFGYKYGIPLESDMIIDVRHIPNPFYQIDLKHRSGVEVDVSQYVFNHQSSHDMLKYIADSLNFMVPNFLEEGRKSVTLSIGCTGGLHRSVAFTEKIKEIFKKDGVKVEVFHRDIRRGRK